MTYYHDRMKQLGGKPNRKSPKKGQLSAEEVKLVKQVKGSPVTAQEVARSLNVPDAVITQLWRGVDIDAIHRGRDGQDIEN